MWLKVGIAVLILLYLKSRADAASGASAERPKLPPVEIPTGGVLNTDAPTGSVDLGPAVVTFHEGSGVWDEPWYHTSKTDSGCSTEPDEFGGMRFVCP